MSKKQSSSKISSMSRANIIALGERITISKCSIRWIPIGWRKKIKLKLHNYYRTCTGIAKTMSQTSHQIDSSIPRQIRGSNYSKFWIFSPNLIQVAQEEGAPGRRFGGRKTTSRWKKYFSRWFVIFDWVSHQNHVFFIEIWIVRFIKFFVYFQMEDDQYGAPDQAAEKGFAAELEDVLFVFPLN